MLIKSNNLINNIKGIYNRLYCTNNDIKNKIDNKIMCINWNILIKNEFYHNNLYYTFYNKIKNNFNRQEYVKDMDFLSKKLIAIINYIAEQEDPIDKNYKIHLVSIYFAIKEEDKNDFINLNIDISKFIILTDKYKNNSYNIYLFLANLYPKEPIINDQDLVNFDTETLNKINDVINNKAKQLIGIYISLDNYLINDIINTSIIYNETHYIIESTLKFLKASIENLYQIKLKDAIIIYKTNDIEAKKILEKSKIILIKPFYLNYYIEYNE